MGEGAGRGKKRRKSIPFPLFFTIGGKQVRAVYHEIRCRSATHIAGRLRVLFSLPLTLTYYAIAMKNIELK